jgi:uncharacterized tellurite resistance protein B-like protein
MFVISLSARLDDALSLTTSGGGATVDLVVHELATLPEAAAIAIGAPVGGVSSVHVELTEAPADGVVHAANHGSHDVVELSPSSTTPLEGWMGGYDVSSLVLVFTRHILGEISRADSVVKPHERLLIERICPTSRLVAYGFVTALGEPTEAFSAARQEALHRLPLELSDAQKLEICTQLLELCVIDGDFDRTEGSLLVLAASLLGVSSSTFHRHLDSLTDHVGSVDLDDPLE